ncbi:hypothetical protein [Nonomuraea sp. NPDC005692]|uniref:hypothetical protein n=1 Tax=Nonomuraea sp. NPDC005692 TaxID=3157168 RepID=UPI0033F877BD
MIVLQRSITYAGSAEETAVVHVLVRLPRLILDAGSFSGAAVEASFAQPVNRDTYRADLVDELAVGSEAARFLLSAVTAGSLDALTVPVSVAYRTEDGQVHYGVDSQSWQVRRSQSP